MAAETTGTAVDFKVSGTSFTYGRVCSLTINNAVIDVNSKAQDWDKGIVGLKSWSMECEVIAESGGTNEEALYTALLAGNTITPSIATWNAKAFSGTAIITSSTTTWPHHDVVVMTVSVQGISALAFA